MMSKQPSPLQVILSEIIKRTKKKDLVEYQNIIIELCRTESEHNVMQEHEELYIALLDLVGTIQHGSRWIPITNLASISIHTHRYDARMQVKSSTMIH